MGCHVSELSLSAAIWTTVGFAGVLLKETACDETNIMRGACAENRLPFLTGNDRNLIVST